MAVISATAAQEHATVSKTRDGGTKYTCPYHVRTDSARDGGDVIVAYFEALGYGLGASLRYADMVDDFAFCDTIAPVRQSRSRTDWLCTLSYSPTDESKEEQHEDEDGNLTEDPLEWRYEISSSTATVQVPVWKAWNIDPFPVAGSTGGYVRGVNTLGPVVNSAGIVLDPPLMKAMPEMVLQVSGNVDRYLRPWVLDYVDAINDTDLKFHPDLVSKYDVEDSLFEPYTVKCSAAGAQYHRQNDTNYWRYSYEFRFRNRASADQPVDGWLVSVLDRGLTRSAGPGEDDGFGGSFSQSDDHETGMTHKEPIRGPLGGRVGELVLLDGAGQPLTSSDEDVGVYFRWRVNHFEHFAAIPLKIFAPF